MKAILVEVKKGVEDVEMVTGSVNYSFEKSGCDRQETESSQVCRGRGEVRDGREFEHVDEMEPGITGSR